MQLFQTALTAEIGSVGVTVIENIPFAADFHHAAMVVGGIVGAHGSGLVGINVQVAAADQYALIDKAPGRLPADGAAQLMEQDGRIDQIIQPVLSADGRCFEELMSLKARPLAGGGAGNHKCGRFQHRQHIGIQHRGHGSVLVRVAHAAETGVQIRPAVFRQYARVELRLIPCAQPQQRAVRVVDVSIELIRSGGRIAYGHGDEVHVAEHIIEIVPSIRADGHIRRIEISLQIAVMRILILAVDHAFIAPAAQIFHRGRPADVVAHAVQIAVEKIMRAIYIYPVAKHIGFPVRHIFP